MTAAGDRARARGQVQHTPGPWEYGGIYNDRGGDSWYSVIHSPAKTGQHHTPRAAEALGISKDEALANARLIAAAPDMLEALGVLLEASRGLIGSDHEWIVSDAVGVATEAITKATGQTP